MLKKILLVVVALVAAVCLYAATLPDHFTVRRSILIKAPPELIFPLIDNVHRWREWSPYEGRDPAMLRSYSGPDSGVGATYAWDGNAKVGSGSMEITVAQPPSTVTLALHFIKPFKVDDIAQFTLQPTDGGTEVVWTLSGPMLYVSKLMSVFFNLDRMIGGDFEAGLARLKALAEQSPQS